MTEHPKHRVYLCNTQTIGAHCGYGVGRTHEGAITDALRIAKQTDINAYYNKQTNTVCFSGGII